MAKLSELPIGRRVVARLLALSRRLVIDDIKRPDAIRELRLILRALEDASTPSNPEAAAKAAEKRAKLDAAIQEVFEHWQVTMDYPRRTLTQGRRSKIRARLQSFSVAALKLAITGAARSAWHMGDNPQGTLYNDITTLFKNDEQIDKFRQLAGADESDPRVAMIAELRRESREALDRNDQEAYKRAQQRIRELGTGR